MPRQAFLHVLTHSLSHTHHFLAGAVEAGEFLLRSHTETLPLSPSVSLSLWRPLSMYFKAKSQSAPTNSISCGRPLPNFPLLYSSLSLSLLATITLILIPCLHSPSLILIFSSPLCFSTSTLSTLSFCAAVIQRSSRAVQNNCYSTPEPFSIALSHVRVIQNISSSTPDSFTARPPFRE